MTIDLETEPVVFDAHRFGTAYQLVALAQSADKNSPLLRCTVIEFHETGAWLAATDSYTLLAAWAPYHDDPEAEPAELDEAPLGGVVVADHDKMLHATAVYARRDAEDADQSRPFTITEREAISRDGQLALDGYNRELVANYADAEITAVGVHEAPFPAWRQLLAGEAIPSTSVDSIAATAVTLDTMAKAAKLTGCTIVYHFAGQLGPVRAEFVSSPTSTPIHVRGLWMPVKAEAVARAEDAA